MTDTPSPAAQTCPPGNPRGGPRRQAEFGQSRSPVLCPAYPPAVSTIMRAASAILARLA